MTELIMFFLGILVGLSILLLVKKSDINWGNPDQELKTGGSDEPYSLAHTINHVAILKNALEDMGAEVYIEDGNITIVKTGYVDDFVHIDGDGSISIHELEKGDGD